MKTKQMLIIIFSFLVHKTFLQSDEIKSAPTTYISPITQKYINAIKAKKHLMKPYSLNTVLFKTNGLKEDHNVELEFKEIQYTSISGKVIRLPKGFILLYMGIHPGLGKQNRNLDFPPGLYTKMVIVLNSISKVRMIREYRSYLDNKIEFDVKVRNADKIEIEFPHPIEFVNEITTEIQIEYNVQAWKKETQDTYSMELSAKYISSKIDLPFHPGHFIVSSVNEGLNMKRQD